MMTNEGTGTSEGRSTALNNNLASRSVSGTPNLSISATGDALLPPNRF